MNRWFISLMLLAVPYAREANALINIGDHTNRESVVISGTDQDWTTDAFYLGDRGNQNSVSILNGAHLSASGIFSIGISSYENYWGDGIPAHSNQVLVAGAGSRLDTGVMYVGFGPNSEYGSLIISDGATAQSSGAHIGVYGCEGNRVEVSGAGSSWNITGSGYSGRALSVGYRTSNSSMFISDGASVSADSTVIGYRDAIYNSDDNIVTVTGDHTEMMTGDLSISSGMGNNNRLHILEGANVISLFVNISPYAGGNNGVTVSGTGSQWEMEYLQMDNYILEHQGNSIAVENGGEIIVKNAIWLNGDYTYDVEEYPGAITSFSTFDVNDGGKLTVQSDFDASQPGFNLNNGGTLAVSGQLSGFDTLEPGNKLEAPNVMGNLTVHGIFAPGNSPADAILDGDLTIASDGTIEMELGGYALGSGYDRLTVTGSSLLSGNLEILFLDGFTATNGASFELFEWQGGVVGAFDAVSTPTLSGGLSWNTSDLYTSGQLSVIPEPGTVGLLGLGSFILIYTRRPRARRSMKPALLRRPPGTGRFNDPF